ncbi:MAG TPA: hypothetical protein VIH16_00530, partial [Bellilinea sp.]
MNGKVLMRVLFKAISIAAIISLMFMGSAPILRAQAQEEQPAPMIRAHPVWESVDAWFWPREAMLY